MGEQPRDYSLKKQKFSWNQAILRGKKSLIETNKVLAKSQQNTDFNVEHADWLTEAENGDYTLLEAKISQQHDKKVADIIARREKIYAKQ